MSDTRPCVLCGQVWWWLLLITNTSNCDCCTAARRNWIRLWRLLRTRSTSSRWVEWSPLARTSDEQRHHAISTFVSMNTLSSLPSISLFLCLCVCMSLSVISSSAGLSMGWLSSLITFIIYLWNISEETDVSRSWQVQLSDAFNSQHSQCDNGVRFNT